MTIMLDLVNTQSSVFSSKHLRLVTGMMNLYIHGKQVHYILINRKYNNVSTTVLEW